MYNINNMSLVILAAFVEMDHVTINFEYNNVWFVYDGLLNVPIWQRSIVGDEAIHHLAMCLRVCIQSHWVTYSHIHTFQHSLELRMC